uniref:H15 domain-containing protein n=1 Tax=Anopheles maculatus TaxID=74869 RepID=A0A182T1S1_9DIPT
MAKEITETKPVVSKKLTYADEDTGPDAKAPLITTTDRENNGGKLNKKTYEQMIIETITDNDPRRKGLSFVSIKKTIKGKYTIDGDISTYVKKAFEKLSSKGIVERVSGSGGISGSIRFTKAYTVGLKKQQKIAAKPKPKAPKKTGEAKAVKPVKDKNNNDKKKNGKGTSKPKQPAPHAKLSTKKTAITKTKIARSGGKVRLSIVTPGTIMKTTAKAKLNASKTGAGTKSSKQNGRKKEIVADDAKPKPTTRERNERKQL